MVARLDLFGAGLDFPLGKQGFFGKGISYQSTCKKIISINEIKELERCQDTNAKKF